MKLDTSKRRHNVEFRQTKFDCNAKNRCGVSLIFNRNATVPQQSNHLFGSPPAPSHHTDVMARSSLPFRSVQERTMIVTIDGAPNLPPNFHSMSTSWLTMRVCARVPRERATISDRHCKQKSVFPVTTTF